MKDKLTAIIAAIGALVILTWILMRVTKPQVQVVEKTRVDTIVVAQPQPRDSVLVRYETVRLPGHTILRQNHIQDSGKIIYDTVTAHDSVEVVLPITQCTYTDDSTYTVWVSGYRPSLDSLRLLQRHTETTRTILPSTTRPRRWGIGVQAGCGLSTKGLSPYIGVGVSYNLVTF